MNERIKWLLFIVALEVISILGDYLLKKASLQAGWTGWKQILMGGLIYGLTAIGWFQVMRTFKLFTISIFHSLITIALSILLSRFIFEERITTRELIGIVLGLASISLLIRFQN
jgi:drug/metabolite transporter (DMT)-like permease